MTHTSDLSKCKEGDKLRLRCGGEVEIKTISVHKFDQLCCLLYFVGEPRTVPHVYSADGSHGGNSGSIFDITYINEVKIRRYATLEELAADAERRGIEK